MTNLKLITTETFGDLSCNFYRNMNDDILLTRERRKSTPLGVGWIAQKYKTMCM